MPQRARTDKREEFLKEVVAEISAQDDKAALQATPWASGTRRRPRVRQLSSGQRTGHLGPGERLSAGVFACDHRLQQNVFHSLLEAFFLTREVPRILMQG